MQSHTVVASQLTLEMSADCCDKLCKKDSSSVFNNKAEVLFKVLIIGDVNVGKSSLLQRFVENRFVNAYSATIGVDLKTTKLSFGQRLVKLQVWDTAGHERFRSMTSAFYRGTHGAVLLFDITKYETFTNIEKWLKDLNVYTCDHVSKILCGNKSDIPASSRAVSKEMAFGFAESHNMSYFETSAKTGDKVQDAFRDLVNRMLDHSDAGAARKSHHVNLSTSLYLSNEVTGNQSMTAACSC